MNLKDYPVVTVEQVNRFRGKALTEIYRLENKLEQCICKGNWQSLIKKYQKHIDEIYVKNDLRYRFMGIMWAEDDFYFVMHALKTASTTYCSCVGDLEGYGYELETT